MDHHATNSRAKVILFNIRFFIAQKKYSTNISLVYNSK
jgi:hypothetical protein